MALDGKIGFQGVKDKKRCGGRGNGIADFRI
jgi:hypothetical protein